MNTRRLFTIAVIIFAVALMIYRIFHSVEVSDEAYGIAEIYNSSLGRKPIVDIWDPHTGWFLFVPLIKIFVLLSNSLEGIVLFFRFSYIIFVITVIGITYFILRNKCDKDKHELLILACASAIFYVPFSIPQIGYNAGVSFLLILVFALLYTCRNKASLLIAGLLMGLTCILYPTMAILTALLVLIIWLMVSRDFHYLLFYIFGVAIIGGLFFLWIVTSGSLEDIIEGIRAITSSPHEANKGSIDLMFLKNTYYDRLSVFFTMPQIVAWAVYLFICLLMIILRLGNTCIESSIHAAFLVQQLLYVQCSDDIFPGSRGGYLLFAVFLVSVVLSVKHQKILKWKTHIGIILLIGWMTTYCLTSDNKNMFYGFDAAGPLVIFVGAFLISILWNTGNYDQPFSTAKVASSFILPLALLVIGMSCFYGYIYRDADFSSLNSRVNHGIFKGLYTSEEQKNCVEKLESEIQKNINKTDRVCTVNNMPALYLMCNADICAPQTWDSQYLSRGYTSSQPLLSYFTYKNEMPDVMIASNYIDDQIFQRSDAEIWDYIENNYNPYATLTDGNVITKIWKKK